MPILALASSLRRTASGTWTKAWHPNVRRCETSGFLPCHLSNGVTSDFVVEERFRTYVAEATDSPQSSIGTFIACIWLLAASISVRIVLSDTPFCWGECGALLSCRIPCSASQVTSSPPKYSPPQLSERIVFTSLFVYPFSCATNSRRHWSSWDFFLRNRVTVRLL